MVEIGDNDTFRIFVSHKHEDHDLAMAAEAALQDLSGDEYSIRCFVSGSDIPAGADWNAVVRAELARSHMLLLLFTTPSQSWDWCLYEAGLFTRFDQVSAGAVVCLYDPESSPPSPLKNLQGVPVVPDKVARFLTRLCRTTWEVSDEWKRGPLNEGVSADRIESAAQAICRGFRSGTSVYHPCHRVVLDVSQIEEVGARIPEHARVVEGADATTAFTLSVFGVGEGKVERTWGDLLDSVEGREAPWRRQLDTAFAAALREELFEPVAAPLRSWLQNRAYRPVLYRIVRSRGGGSEEEGGLGRVIQVVIVFEGSRATDASGDAPSA